MPTYPLRLGTIGSYIDNEYTITVHCNEYRCHHSSRLDLAALAEKLGRDYDLIGADNPIRRALRCEKCGVAGNVGLIISPPLKPEGPYWRPEK